MSNGKNKNFCLKFNSSVASATLPYYIQSARKMRIRSLSYVTANSGQRSMLIKIQGWTDNNFYFDGVTLVDFTKVLWISHKTDSLLTYENTNNDVWDVVKDNAVNNFNTFRVEVYIDGVLATDITALNPLYIEFFLE